MTLNAFSVFLTVVEEMNFTRAAERLYITQQSLSGYIRRLEEYYGVTLFQRRPTLKLTLEGEAMVACARQVLDSEQTLERRLADITENAAAVLTLGISYQRSSVLFPGIWNQFHGMHPNISLRLHEGMTGKLLAELQSNALDIMVGLELAENEDLTLLPLMEERLQCVLNEALLRKHFPEDWRQRLERYQDSGVALEELNALPMLLLPSGNRIRSALDELFLRKRILPKVLLESSQQTALYHAACCGSGIAIINPLSIFEQIRERRSLPPECHSLLIRDVPGYTVQLAFRRDARQPQYVLDMARCIQEEFRYYSDLLERYRL
ncbi:MAG: LysR family transcriptional regulator [Oscillospiraceae bacterium]|nr:LysR family transcriptional regulator [Oscillospiraceae bacterium]